MTTEEKKKNESIARVAYLIAAADGKVNKDEREVFKQTLQAIQGFEFGEPDTTAFIEKVIADSDTLVRLREFYDNDEIIKAFMAKVTQDILVLKDDKLALRKAFAAWVSICVADKTFSDYERKIIKGLQASCNGISTAAIGGVALAGIPLAASLATLFAPVAAAAAVPVGIAAIFAKMAMSPDKHYGKDSVISDDYIAEIESRCFMIDQIKDQYESCSDAVEKESLGRSIEGLVESFKDFINDTNN